MALSSIDLAMSSSSSQSIVTLDDLDCSKVCALQVASHSTHFWFPLIWLDYEFSSVARQFRSLHVICQGLFLPQVGSVTARKLLQLFLLTLQVCEC